MRRLVLVMGLLLALGACGSDAATVIMVVVENRAGAVSPASLSVALVHDGQTLSRSVSGGGGIAFPTSLVIRADGRTGAATVEIRALGSGGELLAQGTARTTIRAEDAVLVRVELKPVDTTVNTRTAGNQLISSGATGRQVAADALGNHVVVWVEQGSQGTPKVWYRLFDATGKPRTIAGAGKDGEALASQQNQPYYDHPAVGMLRGGPSAGRFVVASLRSADQGTTTDVVVRSFVKAGSAAGGENALTSSGKATNPDVGVSADGTTLVVWQERTGPTGWQVKGALLDASGQPLSANHLTLASFSSNSEPLPAVAGGQNGGFMVVWTESGTARGAALGSAKDSYKLLGPAFGLSLSTSTGAAKQPDVAGLLYGYAAVWADKGTQSPDADGTTVRMRRFDYAGKGLEPDWILNTTTTGDQLHPTVAASEAGLMLAAWTNAASSAGDAQGGIRARALLSDGLPVGTDFAVNTTTGGLQAKPSVAAVGAEAFVAAFTDNSRTKPDTAGSAVRARVVFPAFAPSDGLVGALCDGQKVCGSSLYCDKNSKTGPRCTAQCSTAGTGYCAHGGRCVQAKSGTDLYCAH